MIKQLAFGSALALAAATSHAVTLLSEGFENLAAAVSAGWVKNNLSSPVGQFGWEQGFPVFTAQAGTDNSFAVTNFQAADTANGGTVDNWLMTPTLNFGTANTLTFWTRTVANPTLYPDRLEIRLSTAGGSSATADFTTALFTVNPTLTDSAYPNVWTQYTVNFNLAAGSSGRLAFRYVLPDNMNYSDLIGLDTVTVTAVPEPQTLALMLLGMGVVGGAVRRRGRG